MSESLPDFVIVGAARSGTTSLARYLGAHPDVFVPALKELNFFDRDTDDATFAWYRKQFAPARAGQRIGEATPSYLADPLAPKRMAAVIPDARVLALLRHPVDRAYSHYWLAHMLGYDDRDFATAVADERAGCAPPGLAYIASSRYIEQIERYQDWFGDAVHVELFDDLVGEPRALFTRCCVHIGVNGGVIPPIVGTRTNAAIRQRSLRLYRVLDRWRASRRPGVHVAGLFARWNSAPFTPPPMHASVRAQLCTELAPSVCALAAALGRDLSAWFV